MLQAAERVPDISTLERGVATNGRPAIAKTKTIRETRRLK